MNLASFVPLQNKLRKRKQVQKERRKFMKGLVLALIIALLAIATGCARSAAIAANEPQPSLAPRADDSTKIFLPLIQVAATATEAALVASTPSIAPTDTATPTSTSTPPPEPTTIPTVAPVVTTGASEYFPKIILGKLPAGSRPEKWWEAIIPASSISEQEEICISFNNAKEFENVSYGIYNADKQEYAKPKTIFPQNGKIMRGYSNCLGRLPFSGKGQYELRVWVGDDLAAALPFEVTFNAATPTPWPTATKAPPPATTPAPPFDLDAYLDAPYQGGFKIPFALMTIPAEVSPDAADKVRAVYAYAVRPDKRPTLVISMRIYNLMPPDADILSVTAQWCLTNSNYSHCKPMVYTADDQYKFGPYPILEDTNFSANFNEDLRQYGADWKVTVKILSVVLAN